MRYFSVEFVQSFSENLVFDFLISTFFETPDVSEHLEISVLYLLESETILEMRSVKEKMDATTEKLQNLDLMDIEHDILNIKATIESVHLTISDRAELIASFEIVGL